MIDYQQFCQVKTGVEQGLSVTQIAREAGLDRGTVRKWLSRSQYEESAGAKVARASKLDAHRDTIRRLLASHDYSAVQVYQRLKGSGYEGGYTIVKRFIAQVRPRPHKAYLPLTFAPGECAQVDWGSCGSVRVGNTRRALSFFVMVLCHSRWMYVEFVLGQGQEWFLGCHERAFCRLGAVPRAVMVDNCKTAVVSHRRGERVVYNPQYLDFAKARGFEVRACSPGHPQSKGIVENAVAYVKKNFLSGREVTDFAPLGPACSEWLDTVANVRVHAETRARPVDLLKEEMPYLLPLSELRCALSRTRSVNVCARCRVRVEGNTYSVPPSLAGRKLTLHIEDQWLRLYDGEKPVAEHRRSYERGVPVVNPAHHRELLETRSRAQRDRLQARFLGLCPEAARYRDGLDERRLDARSHVERIVALSEIHGVEAVNRAIRDALELGAYSAEYIANILSQRSRLLPQPGALHLTRASDMLDLELPEPDLSAYAQMEGGGK
jgi:transposase